MELELENEFSLNSDISAPLFASKVSSRSTNNKATIDAYTHFLAAFGLLLSHDVMLTKGADLDDPFRLELCLLQLLRTDLVARLRCINSFLQLPMSDISSRFGAIFVHHEINLCSRFVYSRSWHTNVAGEGMAVNCEFWHQRRILLDCEGNHSAWDLNRLLRKWIADAAGFDDRIMYFLLIAILIGHERLCLIFAIGSGPCQCRRI